MANQDQDMRQEQLHFQECLDIISQNVARYEQEYEQRHAQVQELYKAVNSGDVELYNQLMTASSLEEHAAASCARIGQHRTNLTSGASTTRRRPPIWSSRYISAKTACSATRRMC